MSTPSVQLSASTWRIRSVQVQLGSSGPISMSEHNLRAASGCQQDQGHRRAEQEAPREVRIPSTTEAVAARGDSLQHLRRRVTVSISRSASPASSSTAVGGSEEQEELRRRMDEYLLREEYYKSFRGEDGEEPLEAFGSPPHTDMGSYLYSGPPTNLADTVSLPGRPRGTAWRSELPTTSRNPEVCPAYVEDSPLPGATYGALDGYPNYWPNYLLGGSGRGDTRARRRGGQEQDRSAHHHQHRGARHKGSAGLTDGQEARRAERGEGSGSGQGKEMVEGGRGGQKE